MTNKEPDSCFMHHEGVDCTNPPCPWRTDLSVVVGWLDTGGDLRHPLQMPTPFGTVDPCSVGALACRSDV